MIRSRMASAMVGSPIASCHASMGNWLVTMVDFCPYRSSMSSSRSCRCPVFMGAIPRSSRMMRLVLAHVIIIFPYLPSALAVLSSSNRKRHPAIVAFESILFFTFSCVPIGNFESCSLHLTPPCIHPYFSLIIMLIPWGGISCRRASRHFFFIRRQNLCSAYSRVRQVVF